jgi:hypothetical protein
MDVKIERDRLTETRRELRETRFSAAGRFAQRKQKQLAAATERRQ